MTNPIHGVVAVITRDSRWLVIQRSSTVQAPLRYCFPGGGIEVGEGETQALSRELQEELAAEIRPLRRLWRSRTPWDVSLSWWHAELLSPWEQLQPNPLEVAQTLWLTPEEMAALPDLLSSNRDFLDAWRRGEFSLETDQPSA